MAGGQVAAKNTRGGFICRSLPSGENNEESCGRHSLVHCSPAATHDGDNVGSDDDDDACGGGGEDGGGGYDYYYDYACGARLIFNTISIFSAMSLIANCLFAISHCPVPVLIWPSNRLNQREIYF